MRPALFIIFFGLALLSPPAARAQQGAGRDCEQHADRVYATSEVDEKARIGRRPEPRYPARLRGRRRSSGQVKVRAVLRPDGTVTDIEVLETTDEAYNQTSVEAAKKITFAPALKGGCPVAQSITLFYGYRTY